MKKFLTLVLLVFICLITKSAKSEICFQVVSGGTSGFVQIISEYFGDGHGGYKDDDAKKAYKYFIQLLDKSEESSATCEEIDMVCRLGKMGKTKCRDFRKELIALWRESSAKQQTKKTQPPVSESITLTDGNKKITESFTYSTIRECWRIEDNVGNEVDLCSIDNSDVIDNIVDSFNLCNPEIAWKHQEKCLKKHRYLFNGDKIIKSAMSKKNTKSESYETDDDPCAKIEQAKGFKRLELNDACCIKECGTAIGCSIYNGYIYCPEKK